MTPPKSLLPRKNSPKLPEDNLAGDLLRMIEDAYPGVWTKKKADLTELLTMYVVQRDGKVFNHGYELGRKKGRDEVQS